MFRISRGRARKGLVLGLVGCWDGDGDGEDMMGGFMVSWDSRNAMMGFLVMDCRISWWIDGRSMRGGVKRVG